MTSLDRAATERANRWAVVFALILLAGTLQAATYAWQLASWKAAGFALCVLAMGLEIGAATALFWLATSVGKERP